MRELGAEVASNFPPLSYPYAEERKINDVNIFFVSNLFWCQTLSNYFGGEWIVGLDHEDREGRKNFNSAFYLKPQKVTMERYDKRVLLPLAEYLPFNFLKPLGRSYGIYEFFSQGRETKVFGESILFSPSICYEETFPGIMREGRRKGARLFVNVTNDNYFPRSSLHQQHLYHARLRAVENGIPLVRACNSGVSAAIDCFGRIISRMDAAQGLENCVLSCRVNSYTLATLYSWCGDAWLVGGSLAMLLLFGKRRKKYFLA
jgi:apolipoprotein N-acyltransferase